MKNKITKHRIQRCPWCERDPIYIKYHDEEWGEPVHNDYKHFEFIILESAQAGLSWLTILKKRENYRNAFDGFDFEKIALYNEKKINELMQNNGIIRNIRKIKAAVSNAQAFMRIREKFGSFDSFIWNFVNFKPIKNKWISTKEIPSKTPLSQKISKELKKQGFSFFGPTITYSYMQAVGIVNDHIVSCFKSPWNKDL